MSTPYRGYSSSYNSSSHMSSSGRPGTNSSGLPPHQSTLLSQSGNPFRSSSSSRDNNPSFADCFAGFESTHFHLGESPGVPSPVVRPRSASGNLPLTSGAQAADMSYNSLQLSTDVSQPGTPPPKVEHHETVRPLSSGPRSMSTPQRPPLYPNISPIGTPNVDPIYYSSPRQSTSVAAVSMGYVSPGHNKGALREAQAHTPVNQQTSHRAVLATDGDAVSDGGSGEPTPSGRAGLNMEETQEQFQRSMREAEEEAGFSGHHHTGDDGHSHNSDARGSSGDPRNAPSTEPVEGRSSGTNSQSKRNAPANDVEALVASLSKFAATASPEERAAMVHYLTLGGGGKVGGSPSAPSPIPPRASDHLWSSEAFDSIHDIRRSVNSVGRTWPSNPYANLDPFATIAPDFSYHGPYYAGLDDPIQGYSRGRPSHRWYTDSNKLLWKAGLEGRSLNPLPFGTSSGRQRWVH